MLIQSNKIVSIGAIEIEAKAVKERHGHMSISLCKGYGHQINYY